MKKVVSIAVLAGMLALPLSCTNMTHGQQGATTGGLIGAGVGAGVGLGISAIAGGSLGAGAIAGGALGAVSGAIIGYSQGHQQDR